MSNMNASPLSVNIADVLLVSNDTVTIKQLSESMQQLATSQEVCVEVPAALVLLNWRKFDAVIVDSSWEVKRTQSWKKCVAPLRIERLCYSLSATATPQPSARSRRGQVLYSGDLFP